MSNELQRSWMDLVQEYSSCVLTRSSDKLFAFSGIAKLFQIYTNDVYIAGLWKSQILSTMDWYVKAPKPLFLSTYRAPSWSWAALDGPVSPHFDKGIYDVKVLDLHVITGSDPTIDVTDAHLRLTARIVPATYQYTRTHGGYPEFALTLRGYQLEECIWYPDYIEASKHDTFTSEGSITCMLFKVLPWSSYWGDDSNPSVWDETQLPWRTSFLALEQVESHPSELAVKYRRIDYMEVLLTGSKRIILRNLSKADTTIV